MLSLVLCACGPDSGDKTTGTDTSSDTQDTTTAGTSEPTGTTTGTASTDATDTGTTTGTATTEAETTSDASVSSLPTGVGCENFLPPIEPATLEPVALDTPFEVGFMVPGLEGNTTWELTGDLPPGVVFTVETGILGGTPTMAGMFSFWLDARPTMDNPDCSTVPTGSMYELVVSE